MSAWVGPRYDDAFALLKDLQQLAGACGATELVAPLERLVATCRSSPALLEAPTTPPRLLVPRDDEAAVAAAGAAAAVEVEATAAGGSGGGLSALSPWANAVMGDARLVEADGEPWEVLRQFAHVVKARWLIDLLRRAPGAAPKCELSLILKAHDAAQAQLAEAGWLPATIVAPGSSSAKLAETFPEEMCPNY